MHFERLFKGLSYATVFCGFFALWIAGAFSIVGAALFVLAMVAAWFLEGSRYQISERVGTALIVLAIPAFYLLGRSGAFSFSTSEAMLPSLLARLILTLTAIKLLQRKSDRDWIFLYIMAFFQVLLAAGLSISALYLASFIAFTFFMVSAIILFEMRKTERSVKEKATVKRNADEPRGLNLPGIGRIPATSFVLIALIIAFATPLFFVIPRVGGAGIGADPGGVSARSGFSDRIQLGAIGKIQQSDEVVMRVRLEGSDTTGGLKWRGIALDTFDGKGWSKSKPNTREPRLKGERDVIQVDFPSGRESLLLQTIYLEPLDTPVLFAAPRAVGVQGAFQVLMRDSYGAIYFQRPGERLSYRVLSDTSLPPAAALRADAAAYPIQFGNYLQLPDRFDARIEDLAASVTEKARNRLDAAVMIEEHLQTQFGYTLEQKAAGDDPLTDFLFNVREGHCEYFATSMALMLRSQGIATRVVTGFQQGEYNETADAFVVRQRHAHAWVEVYFPGEEAWVTFDPTPAAGLSEGTGTATGMSGKLTKYLEALEMFWIQYFVAFDNQEQRSLFASLRKNLADQQASTSNYLEVLRVLAAEWWKDIQGENGFETRIAAVGYTIAALFILLTLIVGSFVAWKRLKKLSLLAKIRAWFEPKQKRTVVEFYERMVKLLAERGLVRQPHQTPLEFAFETSIPEAVSLTRRYNSVRFGEAELSPSEREEIEDWLGRFSTKG